MPGSADGAGDAEQPPLPGLELPDPGGGSGDGELAAVAAELRGLDGDGSRMAAAIRGALDMLLDGQRTGRYRWDQLHKIDTIYPKPRSRRSGAYGLVEAGNLCRDTPSLTRNERKPELKYAACRP
jgi:hypothetical protein